MQENKTTETSQVDETIPADEKQEETEQVSKSTGEKKKIKKLVYIAKP